MKSLISLAFGALVGVSGAFLHNAYRPIGLVVSLLAVILGLNLVRNMYLSKSSLALFAFGWLFVIVRASSLGNGGEVLIQANAYGNLLVFAGAALISWRLLRRI
ncbi:MAG: hypothetical protein FJW91_04380 [Actinobacteria bacterium]|nr:hypothetical protein [Actinomycetota bacterium]